MRRSVNTQDSSVTDNIRKRRATLAVTSLIVLTGLAVAALACEWRDEVENSVRFRSYFDSTSDFRLLPPMPKSFVLDDGDKVRSEAYSEARDRSEQLIGRLKKLYQDAEEAIALGDLKTARTLLRRYLDSTEHPQETVRARGPYGSYYEAVRLDDRQERRNSAQDRLDAMRGLDAGSRPEAVGKYLGARDAYDAEVSREKISAALDAV